MKKILLYLFLAVTFCISSCDDFLYVRPVGSTDGNTFLNYEGINYLLTSMYSEFYQQSNFAYAMCNWLNGDVLGGTANKGSNFTDQTDLTSLEIYSIIPDNGFLRTIWRYRYHGIFKANDVISKSNQIKDDLSGRSGESKDFYTETIAQACFVRGLFHFELIKTFGAAVPYIGSEEFALSTNPQVSNVDDAGNYIYIWDKVEADLQYAYDNLPDIWSKEKGRANKWAAAALLAKVKMYRASPYNGKNGAGVTSKWAEVKTLIEAIMSNGKDNAGTKFKLAANYEDLWIASRSDWTGESVFDVQYAISGTQTNTNTHTGGATIGMVGALGSAGNGFFQPSHEMVNTHIVDANGLPYTDYSYRNMPVLSTVELSNVITDLSVYTDPRLDVSTGRMGTPFWDWAVPTRLDGWIRDLSNGGPYLNKKYIGKKSDNGSLKVSTTAASTAKNYHYIRYADVLLWYAEALIETGNHQGAREYVNQVRARVANWYLRAANPVDMSPTTSSWIFDDKINGKTGDNAAGNYRIGLWPESQFATKEGALTALRFERKIELGLEGHHWFDLARWGIVAREVSDYIKYESQYIMKFATSTYGNNWVTLPIPNAEIITLQGVLVQGENWK